MKTIINKNIEELEIEIDKLKTIGGNHETDEINIYYELLTKQLSKWQELNQELDGIIKNLQQKGNEHYGKATSGDSYEFEIYMLMGNDISKVLEDLRR